jgi:hypothetical protein
MKRIIRISVGLPEDLHAQLARAADSHQTSLSGEVLRRVGAKPLTNRGQWQKGKKQPHRLRGNRYATGIPPSPSLNRHWVVSSRSGALS